MEKPKKINKNYVLVKISKELQRQKRGKVGSLHVPPQFAFMRFNLQQGQIVMVGSNIESYIPGIAEGDRLVFHHSIEGTVESQNKNQRNLSSRHVIDEDEENTWYMVRKDLMYACIKPDGSILMAEDYVFGILAPDEEANRNLVATPSGILLFKNFKEDRLAIEERIGKLKTEAETHPQRAALLEPEMELLTKSLNKKKVSAFVPVFSPASLSRDFGTALGVNHIVFYEHIGASSETVNITSVDIDGYVFYALRRDYILFAKLREEFAVAV